MDTNTLLLWIIGIFAVVVIIALLFYRSRAKAEIKGPFGTGVTIDASNDPPPAPTPPGVSMTDVKAGKDATATNKTGGGVTMQTIDAKGNVTATAENPTGPKAPPPA